MAERRISYLDKNFDDYKKSILAITKQYYPSIFDKFNDASIGSWFVDIYSDIADNLSYHIDRTYQETSIDSAQSIKSIYSIAKSNGIKIPSPKAAIVEIEFSCILPLNEQDPNTNRDLSSADENYAPIIKRGTLVSDGLHTFELQYDVDFSEQFNINGQSDRQIIPRRDSNGIITGYIYKKIALAVAGQSKVYKKVLTDSDIKPFMTITLQDKNILSVESIIVKDGVVYDSDPTISEFYTEEERDKVERFYEVESLIEQYRYGVEYKDSRPVYENVTDIFELENPDGTSSYKPFTNYRVYKGEWKPLKHKFMTEYNDNSTLNVVFGSGLRKEYGEIPQDAREFTKHLMSRMTANNYMGILPKPNSTMYILYRIGGGSMTNIATDSIKSIVYLNMDIAGNCDDAQNSRKKKLVNDTLSVRNTTPSYGGKDKLSVEELKYYIKYNIGSQNRCVTLKDYQSKLMNMPEKFGVPFRTSVSEENNKIIVYTLGLDYQGLLTTPLPNIVSDNIKEYLSNYKMLNDFIEVRSGKIINIGFGVDVFIDKSYDKSVVIRDIKKKIADYMDVKKHIMGEDIFLGDLEKEISKLDGVVNLINLKVYNKVGKGYSDNIITQALVNYDNCAHSREEYYGYDDDNQIDLIDSDKLLYCNNDSMFEIRYPSRDINVNVKVR